MPAGEEILHPVPDPPRLDHDGLGADALSEPVETESEQGVDEE